MALQPKIIACGNTIASFAMAVRFITGPAVMAAASIAVGLRGVLLHIAIVQVRKKSPTQTKLNLFGMTFIVMDVIKVGLFIGRIASRDCPICVC